MAVASSFQGKALPPKTLVLGEVGLNGEIRPVAGTSIRLHEAARLGFEAAILPKKGAKEEFPPGLRLHRVSRVEEALDYL